MRIAICSILASIIETVMTMRAIALQLVIEKKALGKQSGPIPDEQGNLVLGGLNSLIIIMMSS